MGPGLVYPGSFFPGPHFSSPTNIENRIRTPGVTAAIGAGVVAFVLLIVIFAAMIYRRRAKSADEVVAAPLTCESTPSLACVAETEDKVAEVQESEKWFWQR